MCEFYIKVCHSDFAEEYLEKLKRDSESPSGSYRKIYSLADLEDAVNLDRRYSNSMEGQFFLQKLISANAPIYLFQVCRGSEKEAVYS